jgi:cell wall-associated NlpC family hydrolase
VSRRGVAALAVALVATLAGTTAAALPSRAAGASGDPGVRAAALAAQVSRLQVAAEAASERYDAAQAALGQVVTAHLLADQAVSSAQGQLDATAGQEDTGLRALYESGGTLGLYASVLAPGGLSGLDEQMVTIRRLLGGEEAASRGEAVAAARVTRADSTLAGLAATQTRLVAAAQAASDAVLTDLATSRALLVNADAQVRALAAADAATALQVDEAQFVQLLAASGATPGSVGAPAGSVAAAAIAAIKTKLGTPYQWGGTGPVAYDCSGLVGFAYESAGVSMPRTAAQQYLAGTHPSLAQLRPGDLLFWGTTPGDPASIYHVAMYAGGNLMWSDDHTGDVARLQPIWSDQFFGATRVVPALAAQVPGPRWAAGT